MSWQNDGSAELNDALRDVVTLSDELIAQKLETWEHDGVTIDWGDFLERKYLREAARRLRKQKSNVQPKPRNAW